MEISEAVGMQMPKKMTDLEYIKTGFFVYFIPNTKEGENAYNKMCDILGNNSAKILNRDLKNVLGQLKKSGYSVKKGKKSTLTMNQIFKELDLL